MNYNNVYSAFADDIFDRVLNSGKNNQVKVFSVDSSDLEKVLDEIFSNPKVNNSKKEDMNKKLILPQYNSKYRIVERTANNRTLYFVEFCNPTKIGDPVYQPVPDKHTYETIEESKQCIAFWKEQFKTSEKVIYEE